MPPSRPRPARASERALGASRRLLAVLVLSWASIVSAVPPLVIGDVPTAERGSVELYAGVTRSKSESVEWAVPSTELVLGVSRWQELTLEVPYLLEEGAHGLGDIVLGTKVRLLRETPGRPGLAGSVEWKLANGERAAGLGSGSMELGLLLRVQKTWAWATLIANAGYTFVGEPEVGGVSQPRRDTPFLGLGGKAELGGGATLLADLYWRRSDTPGEPARAAGDLGLRYRVRDHLAIHGAVGSSVRPGATGGPDLRIFLGLEGDFTVF